MFDKALFKPSYPAPFETFWKAYGSVKNSSKPDAYKAFRESNPVAPPLETLLICVSLYRSWLADERKKNPNYPQCHAASWLRSGKWESWLEAAQAQVAINAIPSQATSFPPDQIHLWQKLESEIGTPDFQTWFSQAQYENGIITVPKSFQKQRIDYKYLGKIARIFGENISIGVRQGA